MKYFTLLCFAILLLNNFYGCASSELTMGRLLLHNERYVEAIVPLNEAVKKNPKDFEAWYNLGYAYYMVGYYEGMNKAFQQCHQLTTIHDESIAKFPIDNWVLGRFGTESVDTEKRISPLIAASRDGNRSTVDSLLQYSKNIDVMDIDGKTALIYAAENGNTEIVRSLINAGANVNAQDNRGNTALHLACLSNHYETVTMLLPLMKNPSQIDKYSNTALHVACMNEKNFFIIDYLLKNSLGVNDKGSSGRTPLSFASQFCNQDIITLLIDHGARLNDVDIHGWNALFYAVSSGRDDSTRNLVPLLWTVENKQNKQSYFFADHYAAANFHVNALKELLKRDNKADKIDDEGRTPLMDAADTGNVKSIELLLIYGANINAATVDGYTPLVFAVRGNKYDAAKYLIRKGALVNVKTKSGLTPLLFACSVSDEMMLLLLENGADQNVEYKTWTPLMYAAAHNYYKTITYLLQTYKDGKQLLKRNDNGIHSFDIALSYKNYLIVEQMIKRFPELLKETKSLEKYGKEIQYDALSHREKYALEYPKIKLDSLIHYFDNLGYNKYVMKYAELGISLYQNEIMYYKSAFRAAVNLLNQTGNQYYLLAGYDAIPEDYRTVHALSEYYYSLGKKVEAKEYLLKAIAMNPKDTILYLDLFKVIPVDSSEEVRGYADQMIRQFPNYLNGYIFKAWNASSRKNFQESIRLIKAMPPDLQNDVNIQGLLAINYFLLEEYETASGYAEQIISKDSSYSSIYALMGTICFMEKKY
ncbi:MAG: ankyrin repeat domain-containing protein, partial [Bacteroidota bacterium]